MFTDRHGLTILYLLTAVLSFCHLARPISAQDQQPTTPNYESLMEPYYLFRQRFTGSDVSDFDHCAFANQAG